MILVNIKPLPVGSNFSENAQGLALFDFGCQDGHHVQLNGRDEVLHILHVSGFIQFSNDKDYKTYNKEYHFPSWTL